MRIVSRLRRPGRWGQIGVLCLAAFLGSIASASAVARDVVVLAPPSLADVMGELAERYTQITGVPVHALYASSESIAAQLERGSRADVVIVGSESWMDTLASRRRIAPATRVDLASNRLVLVAPRGNPVQLALVPHVSLPCALGTASLAMANPDRFPAGQVAREALTSLGVWSDVASHLHYTASDRIVLSLLAHGEAGLGVVYATEARGEPLVRVVDTFPASSHAPIRYPLALAHGASVTAAPFVAFLRGADAAATFGKYGFGNPNAIGIGTEGPP